MSKASKLSEDEINLIKLVFKRKFNWILKIAIFPNLLSCLLIPALPNDGRKGGILIESMTYWESVLTLFILISIGFLMMWLSNNYRAKTEFSKLKVLLRKRQVKSKLTNQSKIHFSSYSNIVVTDSREVSQNFKVKKTISENLKIGDELLIEYEEQTSTVFKIDITHRPKIKRKPNPLM